MIKSAGSFFMPPVFAAVDPLILFPTPPLIEPLTSDCSFKNVGEGSWPPDVVQMYIKKSGLVKFEILLIINYVMIYVCQFRDVLPSGRGRGGIGCGICCC